MRRPALLAALLLSTQLATQLALPSRRAAAQADDDDWSVKRDPFDKAVIAKYKAILARDPHDAGALAKLLSLYRRYRTVELLESEYQKVLDKKPGDFATLVVLGHLRKTQGDQAGALARYEEAAKVQPDDAGLQLDLGELYRGAGKTTEARAAYDKALAGSKAKATKMKALRALADLALAGGDIDGAKQYFEAYIALDPKNLQLRVELGDALTQAGKHDDAIAAYRDAEKKAGGDAARKIEIVARIGQALEAKGDDDAAVVEYRRAIKLAPKGYYVEVELTARIVDIYRRKQDLATLLAYYEKEWPVSRRGHFEWSTLATLYEETGDQDKAITAYKKAVAKSPWELETQRKLIQLLTNVGREDEAIKQYEAVVRIAPSEANFQLELAQRYEAKGDRKKALAVLKRLESTFPSDPSVQAALADLYQRWGKDDLALAAYERLAKLEPDDPAHLVVLGEQYWQKGEKDKALATWKRIVNAKTARSYAKLGDVLAEHQMQTDGLANYAKALKMDGKDPEIYKGRAAIYESMRSYAEAMADWEKLMSLLGDKPQDRTARREARRHIVSLLTRWGAKEAEYRNKWVRDFKKTPPDLEAGYFLVEYFDRRPQSGEPRGTLEKLRKLAPQDQDVISDLVKAYRATREFDKAVALLLELEQLAPHRKREIYSQIAEIKTDALQDDEAIEWAKKAVELSNSKDPVAWERLAERYVDMHRNDDAIAAYEKTLELDRRNFKAAFALAELYAPIQPMKAAELYRRILKDATDDETLVKAGREAMQIEEATGTLGELERVIAPLAFQMAHKPVYRRILVDLDFRLVRRLVDVMRHGDADARAGARAELDRLGQHSLKPMLEALNDDRDVVQQRNAVKALGHLGNPGAAAPLIRLAKTEPKGDDAIKKIGTLQQSLDWEVRVEALVSAGRLGSPTVLADVLPLAGHAEVAMREAAVFTIGRTHDKRAVAPLIAALDDRRESVQVLACFGLASLDEARATAAAIAVVADADRHDLARAACAWALGVRKTAAAVPAL
ncbi:MAG: tetratricopeptide repeat protein, partial [Myxococcales bacterium]|nr:tetratricopeptide repeat protein [Myxococcales bacterium]